MNTGPMNARSLVHSARRLWHDYYCALSYTGYFGVCNNQAAACLPGRSSECAEPLRRFLASGAPPCFAGPSRQESPRLTGFSGVPSATVPREGPTVHRKLPMRHVTLSRKKLTIMHFFIFYNVSYSPQPSPQSMPMEPPEMHHKPFKSVPVQPLRPHAIQKTSF